MNKIRIVFKNERTMTIETKDDVDFHRMNAHYLIFDNKLIVNMAEVLFIEKIGGEKDGE